METTFKVYRFDPENGGKPDFATYQVDLPDSATVMDGLRHIRDEQDPSLAFRASCERGSCGDCALRINKGPAGLYPENRQNGQEWRGDRRTHPSYPGAERPGV
jgi:succinate dehydrogenase/fumarate reductase-like Fe-S protein